MCIGTVTGRKEEARCRVRALQRRATCAIWIIDGLNWQAKAYKRWSKPIRFPAAHARIRSSTCEEESIEVEVEVGVGRLGLLAYIYRSIFSGESRGEEMDDDAHAGGQRHVPDDRLVYVNARGIPVSAWRRPRPRHDSPAWLSDPRFALWTATWQAPPVYSAGRRRGSKRARVNATGDAIVLGLPVVTASDVLQSECAICLQDWGAADEEKLRAMPCSHAFHQHCISQWLCRNAVCPLCRHQLPSAPTTDPDREDEEEEEGHEQEDQEQEQEEHHEQELGGGEVEDGEDWEWEDGAIGGESS